MHLILGLGNPGPDYEGTRHNVGFAVIAELALRHRIPMTDFRRRARAGVGRIGAAPVVLAQPLTYMNLSGEAARPLLAAHGLHVSDLVVVHDEADFAPGVARFKEGGGTAGHKGLLSLVEELGADDFLRVRVGVGRPPPEGPALEDYILERPPQAEAEQLAVGVRRAADAIEVLLREGLQAAMRRLHRPD